MATDSSLRIPIKERLNDRALESADDADFIAPETALEGAQEADASTDEPKSAFSTVGLLRRTAIFVVLTNSALFFRGCHLDSSVSLTSGFPMPALVFKSRSNSMKLDSANIDRFVINLAICTVVCVGVAFAAKGLFFSRSMAWGFILTYAAFNLILVAPELWAKSVFRLQVWLLDSLFGNERRLWVMNIFSRTYFFIHAFIVAAAAYGWRHLWKKQIATSKDRWWQFGLTGMFVLMTVSCLLAALIIFLFR